MLIRKTTGMDIRNLDNFHSPEACRQIFKSKVQPANLIIVFIAKSVNQRTEQRTTNSQSQPAEKSGSRDSIPSHIFSFCVSEKKLAAGPLNEATDIIQQKENCSNKFRKKKSDNCCEHIIAQTPWPLAKVDDSNGQNNENSQN